MPVLVTGAESGLGRATTSALLRSGGEVRAYLVPLVVGDDQGDVFRAMGCKTALGEIDDEGRLELALEQVHTVVHCWGGPLTPPDQELDGVAGVLSAALGAGCRRFMWASHLGADAPGEVAYLRTCADAEELLASSTIESIVVRRALTYGPGDELTGRLAGGDAAIRQDARHAPLLATDLATTFAHADQADRDQVRPDLALVLELAGPDVVPLDRFITGLRSAGVRGDRPEPLPPSTVALYARDLEPGPATLGRQGTPLAAGLASLRSDDAR
ncbi:MAG: NAD(P)H-binding protein [Nitriliruptorales bacterium]|nr:NAD(P)H-binding protein [Nitriliruptorales bacterium]